MEGREGTKSQRGGKGWGSGTGEETHKPLAKEGLYLDISIFRYLCTDHRVSEWVEFNAPVSIYATADWAGLLTEPGPVYGASPPVNMT